MKPLAESYYVNNQGRAAQFGAEQDIRAPSDAPICPLPSTSRQFLRQLYESIAYSGTHSSLIYTWF